MMRDAMKLWRDLEKETGEELLVQFPLLTMGSVDNEDFKLVAEQYPDATLLTPEEITTKFPALKNIPSDYKGMINEDCGIVRARKALDVVSKLAQDKYGAKLLFNTKVTNTTKNQVTTEDGTTYTGKHVVIAAGAYSNDFDEKKPSKRREIEYIVFDDPSDMPKGIIEFTNDGNEFYGMLDGDNLDRYKMGEFFQRTIASMAQYFRTRLPDKFDRIKYVHPCYITMIDSGEFQYKTDEKGVHFAYGFSGTGFKFLPLHGKIVYDGLINKFDQRFVPTKFRAKM